MPRDYSDKLSDAMGAGFDSFTARTYARGSLRLRHFRPGRFDPADADEEDSDPEDDDEDDDDDDSYEDDQLESKEKI